MSKYLTVSSPRNYARVLRSLENILNVPLGPDRVNITITVLNIINRPIFYLKDYVSETEF
jgi:hypothetical protein